MRKPIEIFEQSMKFKIADNQKHQTANCFREKSTTYFLLLEVKYIYQINF
jgi:hypothetical protein